MPILTEALIVIMTTLGMVSAHFTVTLMDTKYDSERDLQLFLIVCCVSPINSNLLKTSNG